MKLIVRGLASPWAAAYLSLVGAGLTCLPLCAQQTPQGQVDAPLLRDLRSVFCDAVQPPPVDKLKTCEVIDVDYRNKDGIHKAHLIKVILLTQNSKTRTPAISPVSPTHIEPAATQERPPICELGNPAMPSTYDPFGQPHTCILRGAFGGLSDVMSPPDMVVKQNYYLKVPGQKTVDLGQDFAWPGKEITQVFSNLGLTRWTVYEGAFNRLIEIKDGRHCYVDTMNAPFMGELVRCGQAQAQGAIGYLPGVLTLQEAKESVCKEVEARGLTQCEGNIYTAQELFHSGDGDLSYIIGVGVYNKCRTSSEIARDPNPKPGHRVNGRYNYKISLASRVVSLISIQIDPILRIGCD